MKTISWFLNKMNTCLLHIAEIIFGMIWRKQMDILTTMRHMLKQKNVKYKIVSGIKRHREENYKNMLDKVTNSNQLAFTLHSL